MSVCTKRRRLNQSIKEFLNEYSNVEINHTELPCLRAFASATSSGNLSSVDKSSQSNSSLTAPESGLQYPSESLTAQCRVGSHNHQSNESSMMFDDVLSFGNYDDSNCIDSDIESDSEIEEIRPQLARWVTEFSIPVRAVSALLIISRLYNLDLPKDYTTLMATPTNYSIQNLSGGKYFYGGNQKGINLVSGNRLLKKLENLSFISLVVNIDVLPLFCCSRVQLWPILGMIQEFRH